MAMMVQGKMPYAQAAFLSRAQRLEQLSHMAWEGFGAGTDKGRAFRRLLELYAAQGRTFTTVGLGDAANDLPLLEVGLGEDLAGSG